jgi:anaphase-promoting complex subunit 1
MFIFINCFFDLLFSNVYQVFLATDNDTAPVICFLHQEQKKLLSVRLQSVEINNEILFDIKPDMSWSIAAVAAEPVIVTRPR